MGSLLGDARHGLRLLLKNPGFTLAALAALTLGIGANSALFSLVHALVLRPLPGISEPDRLVEIASGTISYPAYLDFQEGNPALSDLAAYRERRLALRTGEQTLLARGGVVSGNYFAVLGARVVQGRSLTPDDDRPGAAPVAVVSHRFWRRNLGEDRAAVGQTLVIDGVPVEIVGVADPGFRGTRLAGRPDFWIPIAVWPGVAPSTFAGLDIHRRTWGWISAVGRLAPGATLIQAEAALNASLKRQAEQYPGTVIDGERVTLQPAAVMSAGGTGGRGIMLSFFGLLSGVVGLVLLIACANVANLLLARNAARRREIAMRLTLGATRGRLVRQLLTESLLLSLVAAGSGLLLAAFLEEALRRFTLPGGMSLEDLDPAPRGVMIAFTLLMAAGSAILFGLGPALRSSRLDLTADIKDAPAGPGRRPSWLRASLLIAQVALSLILLVGAGLFLRGLQRALSLDPGFRPGGLALASVNAGLARFDAARAGRFYADAESRVAALPGVRSVAWMMAVPLTPEQEVDSVEVEGYVPAPKESMEVESSPVGARYLETLGIPLERGRSFNERDAAGSLPVALINQTAANRFWAGRDPIGGQVTLRGVRRQVVGVFRDFKAHELTERPAPQVFVPLAQAVSPAGLNTMTLLVRTQGDPLDCLAPMRRELEAAGPEVPIVELGALEDRLAELLAPQRMAASLLGWLSVLVMAIAAVGVYGLAAYEVVRRTREIGIRLAMGARPLDVRRMVLRDSLTWIGLGIALGVPFSYGLGRLAAAFLYGVGAADPITYVAVSTLLLSAGFLAAYLPARRAARMDPLIALRYE